MQRIVASISLLLFTATGFAQDGKPNLAQTTEYIKTNLPSSVRYFASESSRAELSFHSTILSGEVRSISVSFSGTQVAFNYRDILASSTTGGARADDGTFVPLDSEKQIWDHVVVATFDMKDIEAVDVFTRPSVWNIDYETASADDHFPMYIVFKAAGGKSAITSTVNGKAHQQSDFIVPMGTDVVKDGHRAMRELRDSQLFKAFEHLRKLSGAPEPLRF